QQSQAEHLAILDAVLQGDAQAAQRLMADHMVRARDYQLHAAIIDL
ncbi:FCD domain-containing protein, partial [Salmonella enterica]